MTPANAATTSRLVIAPVFAILFSLPDGAGWAWRVPVLLLLAVVGELSDWLDGHLARASGTVSDFGKLYDPFADVVMHLSFFAVLFASGALPLAFFLLILYRELGITLVRQMAMRKGLVMGARKGGKLKTVSYVATSLAAFLRVSLEKLDLLPSLRPAMPALVWGFCAVSAVLAVLSFVDYLVQYHKLSVGSGS